MLDLTRKVETTLEDAAAAREQVGRILGSRHFRNSRRCQGLLAYVVESACEGRAADLRERVIGATVFGRDPDYDTNEDAVVRNAAAEVRKRLAQYYLEPEHAGQFRIELPPGSYLPEFHAAPAVRAIRKSTIADRIGWQHAAIALMVLFVASVAVARWSLAPHPAELDRFWAPIVGAEGPVQICVGQSGKHYYPGSLAPNATVRSSEMRPMRDRFLYFGDAICLSRVRGYLDLHGKGSTVRGAEVTPFVELRGKPLVLIGYFNNHWTKRVTENTRFSLGRDERSRFINDRDSPGQQRWQIANNGESWDVEEDLVLVTRVFDPAVERWVIAAGGVTNFGTLMVGEFLSTASYFRQAVESAPKGWQRKNMQVVLRVGVVGGNTGPPKVLATHFW